MEKEAPGKLLTGKILSHPDYVDNHQLLSGDSREPAKCGISGGVFSHHERTSRRRFLCRRRELSRFPQFPEGK
ncbi:hypothetical protein EAJ17_02235 [Akkermansia sp. aa_0143]|nr:hypothetical protein EAJ17_02235 [Akkermansia sp. aa_0143]